MSRQNALVLNPFLITTSPSSTAAEYTASLPLMWNIGNGE